jgi:hippurate hydrolase
MSFLGEYQRMTMLAAPAAANSELARWRQTIHARPELGFGEHVTSAYVADLLRSFGVDEVHEGIGGTGVVGLIRAGSSPRSIGLRADLDALPVEEAPPVEERAYRSTVAGVMHACGHDGHTAMLLGGAQLLAQTRNFDGTVVLIFQPAEEVLDFGRGSKGRGGAVAMLEDGLLERFPVDAMFGMHNRPQLEAGAINANVGPVYASVDRFEITIRGLGGHAARPHHCVDPVPVAARVIDAIQGIASRAIDPTQPVVVSICQLNAGSAFNVIPSAVTMAGTVRTFSEQVRKTVEAQMRRICAGVGTAGGCEIDLDYQWGHPVLVNDPGAVDIARRAASMIVDTDKTGPMAVQMGGEDFAHFAARVPSAYVIIGNGTDGAHGCSLHNDGFDFNDAILPTGAAYWRAVAETALAPA